MGARTPLVKVLPYTAEDLKAAETWLDDNCMEACMVDTEDYPAMCESLATAFAAHVTAALGGSK